MFSIGSTVFVGCLFGVARSRPGLGLSEGPGCISFACVRHQWSRHTVKRLKTTVQRSGLGFKYFNLGRDNFLRFDGPHYFKQERSAFF